MKSSVILAATGAAMAFAAAIEKREVATAWSTAWTTVTVTATPGAVIAEPTTTPEPVATPAQFFEKPEVVVPEAPKVEAPKVEAPKVEAPKVEAPKVEAPKVEAPVKEEAVKEEQPALGAAGSVQEASLKHHNVHRSNHSAPALEWSDKHAGYAMESAKKCIFEHDLTPGGGGYGQNLAIWGATNGDSLGAPKAIARAATEQWYNGELKDYATYYGQEPSMSNFHVWGHFSQMVWVDTTSVGCAAYLCPAGTLDAKLNMWYTVCNYYPAGNMRGSFTDNVLPPGKAATVSA